MTSEYIKNIDKRSNCDEKRLSKIDTMFEEKRLSKIESGCG